MHRNGRRTFLTFAQLALLAAAIAPSALAQNAAATWTGSEGGASAIWIFSNLSFTAMRAQDSGALFWKIVTFIFGFPGTLLTLFVVSRGSERAYGIDMPRRPRA
jgi:hypothetical protein